MLGEIQIAGGKWEEALKTYQTLDQLTPGNEETQFFLGLTHLQLKKYPQAVEVFKNAAKSQSEVGSGPFFSGESVSFPETIRSGGKGLSGDPQAESAP